MRCPILIVSLVFLTMPAGVSAQDTLVPVPHTQILSTNPFGLMINWFNGEYERKLSNKITVGVSASRLDDDYDAMQRGLVFVRLYPQEAALTGIYLGARTGVMSRHTSHRGDSEPFFVTGVEVGRTWLLGSKRNIGLSWGIGVDRFFGNGREMDDLRGMPTVRLINVGIAF